MSSDKRSTFVASRAEVVGDVFEVEDGDSLVEVLAAVGVGAADLRGGDNLWELSMVNTTQGVSAGSQSDSIVVVEIGVGKVSQLTLKGVLRLRDATRPSGGGIHAATP